MSLRVFCDFDGTITKADTADAIFSAFAAPEWRDVEALWEAGEIGSAECMRLQMELVHASLPELDSMLDSLEIDPTFPAFSEFCSQNGIQLTILSDGVDYFIRRILRRFQLHHLPIRANRLVKLGERRFSLDHPFSVKDCASGAGTCKCAATALGATLLETVMIGDGRSDFCVAQEADIVFAKKNLLSYTREQGIPSVAFSNFSDIRAHLEPLVPAQAPNLPLRNVPLSA